MGLLNLPNSRIALNGSGDPVDGAKLEVFYAGRDTRSPIYLDANQTRMTANPMLANAMGRFQLCYVSEGDYRVRVTAPNGEVLYDIDNVAVQASPASLVKSVFNSVRNLMDDELLSYSKAVGQTIVAEGDVLTVIGDEYSYSVVGGTDPSYHLETAGGVRVRVNPSPDGSWPLEAFGAVGDGVTDDTAAIQAAVDAASQVTSLISLTGKLGKTYLVSNTVHVQADGCLIDMRGANMKTSGDTVALEFGSPAGSSASTYRRSGIRNCVFEGSGAGHPENRALVVRNHSYGSFTNNYYTNFGAKPILVQAHGRGVQYNDFRNSEIKDNHDGVLELDSGTTPGGYVNDNLFDNIRAHENPLSGGTHTHVVLKGTGTELVGNRFNNSSFETQIDTDTILDIQNGSANSFWPVRLDGTNNSMACKVADGCEANWFWLQGVQGSFDDASGTSMAFGDRGSSDFPYIQFGTLEDPGSTSDVGFILGLKQPGGSREFHFESITGTAPFRFPGNTPAWFGDRQGGENAPIQINGNEVLLRTLPSTSIGAGPRFRFEGEYSGSGDEGNVTVRQGANGLDVLLGASGDTVHSSQAFSMTDGIPAPGATSGRAKIYVDSADGDLKVVFGDGVVKTIVTDS